MICEFCFKGAPVAIVKKVCIYSILLLFPLFFGNKILSTQEIDLRLYEKRLISQDGEDGVIEEIFNLIGTTSKYYVEFGAGQGHDCSNTKYLREKFGWTGLLMDGGYADPSINLHKEFITAENICDLFKKYGVPYEFDLISIDIDGNDFYVWRSICAEYKPRVIVIEFNSHFNFNEDKVIQYDPRRRWNGTRYFGSSVLALYNLGRRLGYSLVYQESNAVNLFFIRDDILESTGLKFKNVNNIEKIYTGKPGFRGEPNRDRIKFVSSSGMFS